MSLSLDCINPTEIVVLLELLGSSLDENETKVVFYSSYLSYIIPQTSSRDVRHIHHVVFHHERPQTKCYGKAPIFTLHTAPDWEHIPMNETGV